MRISWHALCRELQNELIERIRQTVTLPVRIDIIDKFDATCTELLVTASLDSGGRGRPRVIYDVTAALSRFGERFSCLVTFFLPMDQELFNCMPDPKFRIRERDSL